MSNVKGQSGTLYGVGVGPGDPELMTLKSVKILKNSHVWVYLINTKGHSQALDIVSRAIDTGSSSIQHLRVNMPMDRNPDIAVATYKDAANQIAIELSKGKQVSFLCEGDPLFFGSFIYLLEQLHGQYCCDVVPGITSPQAAASAFKLPLAQLDESYAVLSGRHSDETILDGLKRHDTVVFLKVGKNRQRILELIANSGRCNEAKYGEFIGRDNETLVEDLTQLSDSQSSPYFSIIVVTRSDRGRI